MPVPRTPRAVRGARPQEVGQRGGKGQADDAGLIKEESRAVNEEGPQGDPAGVPIIERVLAAQVTDASFAVLIEVDRDFAGSESHVHGLDYHLGGVFPLL